jgi:hypothetical protein
MSDDAMTYLIIAVSVVTVVILLITR